MKQKLILNLVYTALFCALIFIATQFLRIPMPFGYFNFGDCLILISAVLLGWKYSITATVIGSVFADILSGYTIYAPATAIIKSLMAVCVILIIKGQKERKLSDLFLSSVIAETIMVSGYFIFDSIIFGFAGAVASITGNILQGIAAVISFVILTRAIEKTDLGKYIK